MQHDAKLGYGQLDLSGSEVLVTERQVSLGLGASGWPHPRGRADNRNMQAMAPEESGGNRQAGIKRKVEGHSLRSC